MSRAQTTMDFAAGVSIFLVTVAFAFAFVPGIITPFADPDVGDPVSANRIADDLVTDRLASPNQPYALDTERTAAFFADGDAISELALRDYKSANVTLVTTAGDVATIDGERAAAGQSVSADADATVAWRSVTVVGDRYELVVKVW
ncbi:DUF7287 family protein [Halobacterium noricense]|uniref:DUF7287 family protein n=1 Tax=Halobacterium noricense TaxID=223182 RepID=UPI001E49A6F5|nr:hypothetical protein [Halobacterium noricense]UHH26114.1 hypothetical protein LT974_04070 [Halobacterium noricense]